MKYQTVRGMRDLLPSKVKRLRKIEDHFRTIVEEIGYEEIRTPVVEYRELFESAGETSKQMYQFTDKGDRQLVLRPEGTASVARAYINNPQELSGVQKLWYNAPMFRYERPQRGRYRQFNQLGIEFIGVDTPESDAEVIQIASRVCGDPTVDINYLGTPQERTQYVAALVEYLKEFESDLDEASRRNLTSNPLRILDSKNPKTQEILQSSPRILDFLESPSRDRFQAMLEALDGVDVYINPSLVRGLDYYSGVVFEILVDGLAVCGGGRYNSLIESLGGNPTPAVGMAIGLDRLEIAQEKQ